MAVAGCAWLLTATPVAADDSAASIAAGRKLAEMRCSACHAVGTEDTSLMAGAPPLRDLERRYPIDNLAEALAEGIVTGHPQMPVFTFSASEIENLLTYLDQLR